MPLASATNSAGKGVVALITIRPAEAATPHAPQERIASSIVAAETWLLQACTKAARPTTTANPTTASAVFLNVVAQRQPPACTPSAIRHLLH